MKTDGKFSILRTLALFLAGACFFTLWLLVRVRYMDPMDKTIFIKQTCIQVGSKAPAIAHLFQSCRDIAPETVHKFACGPDYFPAAHYCHNPESKPGCHAEYYTDAVNADKSVECSCRVYCDDAPAPAPNTAPAHPPGGKKT